MQGGGGGEFNGNFALLDYKSMYIRKYTIYHTYKLNSYMHHIVYIPMLYNKYLYICTFHITQTNC